MADKTTWRDIISRSITSAQQLAEIYSSCLSKTDEIHKAAQCYPMFINPYYLGLIKQHGDPLWKQAVPDLLELSDAGELQDPLAEEAFSPVPGVTHRYPDRVLFLVSNRCAMHCRFCTRKRKIGKKFTVTRNTIWQGLEYIKGRTEIRDVLVSGGDPLLLEDAELAEILNSLRSIPHVEIIRIGTRVPCTLPQRVTVKLAEILKQFHPVYINTHFNHPDEITEDAAQACGILSNAGIPLGCQTVLLKGINDSPETMKKLMRKLLTIRVRPYYIHHLDPVSGTDHFRTSLKSGIRIIKALRGHISGMCIPHYVIDLPGGGGKVPLLPEYVVGLTKNKLYLRNYQDKVFEYNISNDDKDFFTKTRNTGGGR